MIVLVVVAAAVTVAGALVALSTRDARLALGGLGASLLAAPFVGDPLPGIVPLVGRVVAAILAVELLTIAIREAAADGGDARGEASVDPTGSHAGSRTVRSDGAGVDPRVEGFAVAAGVVAGLLIGVRYAGFGTVPALAPVILGAGFGLLAAGITPLLIARDALRLGIGAIVVLVGATIVRAASGGGSTPLESLVTSGLVVAISAAVAAVIVNAVTTGGDLSFDDTLPVETEREVVAVAAPSRPTRPTPSPRTTTTRRRTKAGA